MKIRQSCFKACSLSHRDFAFDLILIIANIRLRPVLVLKWTDLQIDLVSTDLGSAALPTVVLRRLFRGLLLKPGPNL